MIKQTVTYTDFNGKKVTEEHYFHLNKIELAELNVSQEGGMKAYLEKIVAEEDNKKIFDMFKKFLLMGYGTKSDDGRRFIKSDELRLEFEQSEAFPELALEMLGDENKAAAFFNGMVNTPKAAPKRRPAAKK